jgi:hypothetical protein
LRQRGNLGVSQIIHIPRNDAPKVIAEALAKAGVKLVPDIVAAGRNGGGTLVDVLLANVIRDGQSHKSLADADT